MSRGARTLSLLAARCPGRARRQPRHVFRAAGPVRRARQRPAARRDSRPRASDGPRAEAKEPPNDHVDGRAGQWNVGLKGAPPPDSAAPVPGDPDAMRRRAVVHDAARTRWPSMSTARRARDRDRSGDGARHRGAADAAVARRRARRARRAVDGGFLTIIGAAVRESVLPPGVEPDRSAEARALGVAGRGRRSGACSVGRQRLVGRRSGGYSRSSSIGRSPRRVGKRSQREAR